MTRLRELRIESGMLQKEVAEKLNMERSTYVRYESGAYEPRIDLLCAMADLFNVSIDYLLYRTDEKSPTPEGAGLNEDDMELAQLLTGLSPAEFAKVAAYIQGLRDNRGASGAPAE